MRGELRRVQKELGITFIHVTHTQLEAIAVADLVVVMAHGRIEQAASAREVFVAPRNQYVARFIGGQNVLSGRVESVVDSTALVRGENGACFAVPVGRQRPAALSPLSGAIRRDRITVVKLPVGTQPPEEVNAVTGEVHAIENQGSYVKVTLDLLENEEFVANVPDEAFFLDPLEIGDRVVARWSTSHVRLLGPETSADEKPVAAAEEMATIF